MSNQERNGPWCAGALDCYQDQCENAPFASVGGIEARSTMRAPNYIEEYDAAEYLDGYRFQAQNMYGDDWQTCAFDWSPALVIETNREREGV